jgi:tRNA A-37 threonylcarbamoyl transferase component Bud32
MTHVDVPEPAGRTRLRRPSGEPPPLPRELNRVAIGWLVGFAFWAAIWLWIFLSDAPAIWITERDLELMHPIVDRRVDWLTTVMEQTNRRVLPWTTLLVAWVVVLVGLSTKRIRHVVLLFVALSLAAAVATTVATHIGRPRPLGMERIGDWEGFAQPSRPITLLTVVLVGAGQTLVRSGTPRRRWMLASAAVILWCTFAQVYLGVEHPTDGLVATTVGVAITLVLFRLGAPEQVFPISYPPGKTAHLDVTGARAAAIERALGDQLGVRVTGLEPIGLAGSAGSTPLHIRQAGGSDLFAKLYARSHLRSDRSYKLGRTLMYGRLEDERPFTSVRRLVQHEDYMLRLMRAAGVDTMEPIGLVEITPDREYLLVTEFLEDAREISDVEVTDDLIDQGLQTVRAMWDAGLAHRDIKPANVLVHHDRLRLIDVAFGEVRPSPWRQAVDLANMMLVLALGSSPERVYERACCWFTEPEIAEAFAACRGVTLPSALRADVRRDGRELVDRFRELAPPHAPVAIQRWSIRRVALTLGVVSVALFIAMIFLGNLPAIGLWR